MLKNFDIYRYPRNFFLNITGSCNLKCIYCSSADFNTSNDMSYNNLNHVLTELKNNCAFNVVVTGGEPLIYPYFEYVIKQLLSFTRATLNSNGVYLSKYIDFFKNLDNKNRLNINISLDSLIQQNNSKTRGNYDIEEIINNIKLLSNYGYCIKILCTFTKYLTEIDLDEFINFTKQNKNISFGIGNLKINGRAAKAWQDLIPSIELIKLVNNKLNTNILKFDYSKVLNSNIHNILECGAGKECVSISNDGTVYPCTAMYIPMGNIFNSTLKEICDTSEIKKKLNKLRTEKLDKIQECNNCKYIDKCSGGCRAIAYSVNNDLYSVDPYCWHNGKFYKEF